ncbi:WD40 repeat-like protein [Imleria badia]|nr:WD40 repeat-like protein [Imleria badia]
MVNARTTINTGRDVWVLVFLEDGKHLLTGGEDKIIRQWCVEDGREVEDRRLTAGGHGYYVTAIALSGDGKWIVAGGWGAVTLFNRLTRQITFASAPRDHSNRVNDVDVSPDSTKFATASSDFTAIIWSISNGRPLFPPLQHGNFVSLAKFSPDGNRIATAVYGGEVRIYNANNGQLLSNIAAMSFLSIARTIVWSSTQHIYVLSSGYTIRHIFVDTGSILSEWTNLGQPESDCYASIALSKNGRFIASSFARSLSFWDASMYAQLGPVLDNPQTPHRLSSALSPDNNYFATGGAGEIILYNLTGVIPTSHRVGGSVVPRARLTPQRIPDGKYRIKSNSGDLYLTGSQGGANTTVVQPLSQSDDQKWTCTFVTANGAYKITSNTNASLTVGIRNALVTGGRGTTWTFEPRGDAFVIGNAVNASAIQLASDRQSVSVFPRDHRTARISDGSWNLYKLSHTVYAKEDRDTNGSWIYSQREPEMTPSLRVLSLTSVCTLRAPVVIVAVWNMSLDKSTSGQNEGVTCPVSPPERLTAQLIPEQGVCMRDELQVCGGHVDIPDSTIRTWCLSHASCRLGGRRDDPATAGRLTSDGRILELLMQKVPPRRATTEGYQRWWGSNADLNCSASTVRTNTYHMVYSTTLTLRGETESCVVDPIMDFSSPIPYLGDARGKLASTAPPSSEISSTSSLDLAIGVRGIAISIKRCQSRQHESQARNTHRFLRSPRSTTRVVLAVNPAMMLTLLMPTIFEPKGILGSEDGDFDEEDLMRNDTDVGIVEDSHSRPCDTPVA